MIRNEAITIKQDGNLLQIASSLAFCAVVLILLIFYDALIRFGVGGYDLRTLHYVNAVFIALLAIPCIIFLGKIVQENGFKFSFSAKGFKKGMFAHLFFLFALFLHLPLAFITTEINTEFVPMIPPIIFFDLAVGVFEEVLMRGIFMTAMLVRFGETGKGRIFCVLLNGLVFGILHFFDGGFVSVLLTGLLGIGFAAAYVYSKNLLSCMVVHALWNIALKISGGLIVDIDNAALLEALRAVGIVLYGAIPLFAIVLTIKSKPLFKVPEPDAAM